MKKSARTLPILLAVLSMGALFFTSCDKDDDDPFFLLGAKKHSGVIDTTDGSSSGGGVTIPDGDSGDGSDGENDGSSDVTGTEFDIYYGQDNYAGKLIVSNDAENLYVTYRITAENIVLNEAHLWVGGSLDNAPLNGQGVPVPGQFPYQATGIDATTYTFTVPFSVIGITDVDEYCGANLYILAHAALSNGETAWSYGTSFSEWTGTTRWGWYSVYVIDCDEGDPTPDMTAQTAFAKGGYVFTTEAKSNPEGLPSLNLTKNRWGWAINLVDDGSYLFDIYAGAGRNYVSKGVKVGTLSVDMAGGIADVSYIIDPGFYLGEVHVYAGDLPPATIAPGRYGHTAHLDPMSALYDASFTVSDTDGDGVWFIAHAVVFGNY